MANPAGMYEKTEVEVAIAQRAIEHYLVDLVEDSILKSIKPRIRQMAKEAVAIYDTKVRVQQGPFSTIDQMLVTFTENVVNTVQHTTTIKEV